MKEIRQLVEPSRWHYASGNINPNDLSSRGCNAKQLIESRWWERPDWLALPKEQWPSREYETNEDEVYSEMKKTTDRTKEGNLSEDHTVNETDMLNTVFTSTLQADVTWYMEKHSTYLKIIRIMAWIRRYIYNCWKPKSSRLLEKLSAKEFVDTEMVVLKLMQEESFNKENESRLKTLDVSKDARTVKAKIGGNKQRRYARLSSPDVVGSETPVNCEAD